MGGYENFEDIEKDFELLFIKHETLCKNLWNEYHPPKVLNVKPAKTIWLFGRSGVGKTVWTKNYLKELAYRDEDICKLKASNSTRPRLWFKDNNERMKVCWIEEVRHNFPENNDLIQIIDKGVFLETKGSHIENNFELVIINSLWSPAEVYSVLPPEHQIEILRRLYKGDNSQVFFMESGRETFNQLVNKTDDLPLILQQHLNKTGFEK